MYPPPFATTHLCTGWWLGSEALLVAAASTVATAEATAV